MKHYYRFKNLASDEIYSLKQPSMVLGRNSYSEIHIDSGLLSRQHAEIRIQGERVVIEDLHSTNGTYVNNMRIHKPTELMHGDVVTVGHEKLMLIAPDKNDGSTVFTYNMSPELEAALEDEASLSHTRMQRAFPEPLAWNNIQGADEADQTQMNRQILQEALSQRQFDANKTPALFVVKSGGEKGAVYDLPVMPARDGKSEWEIGRNKLVDVVIDHPTVSNQHAKVVCNGDHWSIQDTQSTNGLKVNKKRVGKADCTSGDVVSLGNLELIFMVL